MFRAIRIDEPGGLRARLTTLQDSELPAGEVTLAVSHSALNYKDALAITGQAPVVRKFPMIPGIDLAGRVTASEHADWKPGDAALLTGFGLGELRFGGLAQRTRVPGEWLIPVPPNCELRQAAAMGTAGLTAMLAILALERHGLAPDQGEILVTGAGGGVGGMAIALLARRGYPVVAATGRTQETEYLEGLGAGRIIDRRELTSPAKPLGSERWAAAIDTLGSHSLANICSSLRYGGAAAACGLAQGMDFPASVAPFILRGITLYGVDSVMAPMALRRDAWTRLFHDLDPANLEAMTTEIPLDSVIETAPELLAGRVRGRIVVDVNR